MSTCVIKQKHD